MDCIKDFNFNILYFILGFIIGFMFSLNINCAHAETINKDDFDNGMFEALNDVYAPNSVIVYSPSNDTYYLTTFTNDVSFKDDTLYFNSPAWETGSYYYNEEEQKWEQSSRLITQYKFIEGSYVVYSSKNITFEGSDDVYFYKTSSTITNKYYHSVNTVLMQKIPQALNLLVPIGLIIMALFIGVGLIPRILYKFL